MFGTSAATPVVASMLSMINDARLTIGKRPIGFINPTVCAYSLFYSLRFDLRITLLFFRFTPKYFVTLFMTSHLEATKAAAPMDSVLFQDGTQSQA